jgi:hypothetical protein
MSMVGVPEMSFNMWASKFLAKGELNASLTDHGLAQIAS